jgi:hypothetical protein
MPQPPSRRGVFAAVLFFLAIWAFATLFFGGNIGRWNDDYYFTLRNPVDESIAAWATTTREPYLPSTGVLSAWRPLMFTAGSWLITLAWKSFWIAHAVGALLHLAHTLLLYLSLRQFGRSVHAAAATAGLFLCWAGTHESWLWPSAYGSLTAALFLQLIILCMLRYARGYEVSSGRYGQVVLMVVLTIIMLGFHEQASGALPALGLVYLAVADTAEPIKRRLWRAALATASVCILPPLYVLAVRATTQPGLGVNPETYVPLHAMWDRVVFVWRDMANTIIMRDFWYPAFALGWREWTRTNSLFIPWLVVLAVTAIAPLRHWIATPTHGPGAIRREGVRHGFVVLFGILGAAGACMPVAVIAGYPALSRVTYVIVLLLAFSVACLFDVVGRLFAKFDRAALIYRVVTGCALLGLMGFGGVMSIGAQARMKRVVAMDDLNAKQLRELVPDPAPGTVFLPLTLRPPAYTLEQIVFLHPWITPDRIGREIQIHRPAFESFRWTVCSVWEGLWSMKYFVKFAYGRDDVWSLYAARDRRPIIDADANHVRFIWPYCAPYEVPPLDAAQSNVNALIPWEKVIPITFDAQGNLKVVARVHITSDKNPSLNLYLQIPQTASHREGIEASIVLP